MKTKVLQYSWDKTTYVNSEMEECNIIVHLDILSKEFMKFVKWLEFYIILYIITIRNFYDISLCFKNVIHVITKTGI